MLDLICSPDGGHIPSLRAFAVSASVSLRFVLQEGMSFMGKSVAFCCPRTSWLRISLHVQCTCVLTPFAPATCRDCEGPRRSSLASLFFLCSFFFPSKYFTFDFQARQDPSTSSRRKLRVVSRLQMSSFDCSGKDITILSPCTVQ